jgi:primary-amine oxidase
MPFHPLDPLSVDETTVARDAVLTANPDTVVFFREIYLKEPVKAELRPFLDAEHAGELNASTARPARLAKVQYDVVGKDKVPEFHEAWVDIDNRKVAHHVVVGKEYHASLTL